MRLLEQVTVLEGQLATDAWVSIGQRESGEFEWFVVSQIYNMENKDEMYALMCDQYTAISFVK